ncbi:MAG: aminoglycoside phosphotransferase, partial [Aeromicrobium sp.]|nr:aminoglycoside phosphotransferase [Aeromicrobium sp.]
IIAAGWDNTILLIDETWAFRLPRRAIALPGIHRELAWLPTIAAAVGVPVPTPTYVGSLGDPPWPFWGGRFLPGDELARRPEADRVRVGAQVGAILRELHAIPVVAGVPIDPNRRADAAFRAMRARSVLAELTELGVWAGNPGVEEWLARADELPLPTGPLVMSHGDLYARHVLLDSAGDVSAVIDWGDLCTANAAIDLSIAFSAFTGVARDALLDSYGIVDDETLLRARTMGVSSAALVARYAHDTGDSALLAESLGGLAGAGT